VHPHPGRFVRLFFYLELNRVNQRVSGPTCLRSSVSWSVLGNIAHPLRAAWPKFIYIIGHNDQVVRLPLQDRHGGQQLGWQILTAAEVHGRHLPIDVPGHHRSRLPVQVRHGSLRSISVGGNVVKFQIWDTAGQERFRTITGTYYKGAQGIIIVYDLTKKESFEELESYWFKEVTTLLGRSTRTRFRTCN
jgi:hypothetical protein